MSNSLLNKEVLTERLLRSWIRCRRKAWLDQFGDKTQRIWTAHRTLQLDHQQKSFDALIASKPGKGLHACRRGDIGVVGIRLKGKINSQLYVEAHPALLQKVKGRSRWGPYIYRPVIARQGKKITREYKLSIVIIGLLLEQFQDASVKEGIAVFRSDTKLETELIPIKNNLKNQLIESLNNLSRDLSNESPPPIAIDRRKCCLCSWKAVCDKEAYKNGALSEVSGVGGRRTEMLKKLGITNISQLANCDPITLKKNLLYFGTQHANIAKEIVHQAKAQHFKSTKRIDKSTVLPELSIAKGVLIYDIESDPDSKEDFLHGFITLKRDQDGLWNIKNSKYHPILILKEKGERSAWIRLKRKILSYPGWPILHYGETEVLSLVRIAKKQGASDLEIKDLVNRCIDIHQRVKKSWILPINNYSLKTVAGWMGFKWRQASANGAKALLWWRQWRSCCPERKSYSNQLSWIYIYNHDDCLATWEVANWLLKQDSN